MPIAPASAEPAAAPLPDSAPDMIAPEAAFAQSNLPGWLSDAMTAIGFVILAAGFILA
jgi:hypothetical protein